MQNETLQTPSTLSKSSNTDFEVRSLDYDSPTGKYPNRWYSNIKFIIAGILFGIILVKGEVISWFRIQEMFRFESFYMYGVIGTAVVVGMISIFIIKKLNIKTIDGEKIVFPKKTFNKGQVFGGLIFGFGWALTGACPGPIFAQIGTGAIAVIIVFLSAVAGTWVYGFLRGKLPH